MLVSVDTLRRDALGIYGAPAGASPALDALARESIVFDQAVAAANHTAPSHASLLTGVSPAAHGVVSTVREAPRRIPDSLPTLAERLKGAGYACAAETDRGYVSEAFGFERGFDRFRAEFTRSEAKVDRALEWFAALAPGRSGFFFLHTYEVHAPYIPPPADLEALREKFPRSPILLRLAALLSGSQPVLEAAHGTLFKGEADFGPEEVACLRALYEACVRNVDRQLGRLIEELRRRGLLDKTILVITSDHGEEFREHGGLRHDRVFDEIVRVPLIIRLPGGVRGGTRVGETFPAISLVPTLLDMLALPAPRGIEGKSLLESPDLAPTAFSSEFRSGKASGRAARRPAGKVIERGEGPERRQAFFDLATDPKEKLARPVRSSPLGGTLAEELALAAAVWEAMRALHAAAQSEGKLDADLEAELRGLGYVR